MIFFLCCVFGSDLFTTTKRLVASQSMHIGLVLLIDNRSWSPEADFNLEEGWCKARNIPEAVSNSSISDTGSIRWSLYVSIFTEIAVEYGI